MYVTGETVKEPLQKALSLTSFKSISQRLVIETVATAVALTILNFLSQSVFKGPSFVKKESLLTAGLITLCTIGVREAVEGCLMKESMTKTKKVFIRLAGSLLGLAFGVGLMSQSRYVFQQLGLESVSFRQIALIGVSQFLSISSPSACIRFFLEDTEKRIPTREEFIAYAQAPTKAGEEALGDVYDQLHKLKRTFNQPDKKDQKSNQ